MYQGFADGSTGIIDFAGFGISAPENGMTAEYTDGGTLGGQTSCSKECLQQLLPQLFLELLQNV